jgi:AcrR family transcriptional regulator
MNTSAKGRSREPLSSRWKRMSEEEKEQRIVDAVLHVIAKHGVQGTTTARIAAAAGVSEPTIYRTFRSRKDMLLAAADQVWQQRHDELESFEATDAMDHLRKICELHTVGIQRTRVVRFITELAVAPEGDGLREHLREQQLLEARRFAAIVEEGKNQGCIRPEVDAEETAWRIMSVHWLEAMARLHGLEDRVLTGFSTRRFQSILEEIATESAAPLAAQPCVQSVPDGATGPAAEPLPIGAASLED